MNNNPGQGTCFRLSSLSSIFFCVLRSLRPPPPPQIFVTGSSRGPCCVNDRLSSSRERRCRALLQITVWGPCLECDRQRSPVLRSPSPVVARYDRHWCRTQRYQSTDPFTLLRTRRSLCRPQLYLISLRFLIPNSCQYPRALTLVSVGLLSLLLRSSHRESENASEMSILCPNPKSFRIWRKRVMFL
jgi:hypothetical protein